MIYLWWLLGVIHLVNANTETLLVYADPAYEIYDYGEVNSHERTTIPCSLNLSQVYGGDVYLHRLGNPCPIELHNSWTLPPIKTIHRLNVQKGSTYFVSLCWSAIFPVDFSLSYVVEKSEASNDNVIRQNFTVDTPIEELQGAIPGIYLIVEAKPNFFALKNSNFKQYLDEIQYQINVEQCILVPGLTKRILKLAGKIILVAVIALFIATKMSLWLKQLALTPAKIKLR
ncbi:hypothetical protein LJB42_002681 [Komagataella kurtzmanii]|nr:hypothetical protein LJB42_002681 [Komagataella kurtzmanii]